MITGAGSKRLVTIMDFGLALLADRSKLTRLDETMGHGIVTYMSRLPEQTGPYGMELDHRTDRCLVAGTPVVIVYEMVTGQRPLQGSLGLHSDKAAVKDRFR